MTMPPRLVGPRMAVWASFPFDGRVVQTDGTKADWKWAMTQWDRVVKAGRTVRLVVVSQAYSDLSLSSSEGQQRTSELLAKLQACRAVEQLVFARVYAGAGRLPLGQAGEVFEDPLNPGRQVPGVAAQIATWQALFGSQIDGIFLDEGPRDCTDPTVPGSDPTIPGNYVRYVDAIRRRRLAVFVQALQHPDAQSGNPWLRNLGADFLQLWQRGVTLYRSSFHALDLCDPDADPEIPSWWDPGPALRYSRVHFINDCRDAATMGSIAQQAIDKRGARTIWITQPRRDPNLGPVFDVLPPYWDDEVAFFRRFADDEEQQAKDAKDSKANKDDKDIPDDKAAKDDKDNKDNKDNKEAKDDKEGKDDKDNKDDKDAPDKQKEDPKEKAEDKEDKENKDGKDFKDDEDHKAVVGEVFLKDSETALKSIEVTFGRPEADAVPALREGDPVGLRRGAPGGELARGRTFIRAHERPPVGERIVADPDEPAGEDA